jgi:hypothetical protein
VLQHCLQRLWDKASSAEGKSHILLDDYNAIGGIQHALSRHADEILASLAGDEVTVEQTFRALSEIDREGRATRRALPFGQLLAETGVQESALRRVLDRFRDSDCSFLVPSESTVPLPLADTRIDVGHEAFLRRWETISGDASTQVGGHGRNGWLWDEENDGRIYRALITLLQYGRTLPLDQVDARKRGGLADRVPRPGRSVTAVSFRVCNDYSWTVRKPFKLNYHAELHRNSRKNNMAKTANWRCRREKREPKSGQQQPAKRNCGVASRLRLLAPDLL